MQTRNILGVYFTHLQFSKLDIMLSV
jgi:hypothetical protein